MSAPLLTSRMLRTKPVNINSSPPKKSTPSTGKLPVAEPTSLSKFGVILLMHVCRRYLLFNFNLRLAVYVCAVTIGSLFTDLFPAPKSRLADKRNFLNQYFVKLSWGWTFVALSSFISLTSYTYCCADRGLVRRHLLRLAFGTAWWYLCTTLFVYVESITGYCNSISAEHFTRALCHEGGFRWIGFDISGHSFLLTYCLLLICEEAKCISGWERIPEMLQGDPTPEISRLTETQVTRMKSLYTDLTPYVRLSFVMVTLLAFIWELMLCTTILYFHNMPQKLIGALFAIFGWFLSYKLLYPHSSAVVCSVGYGQLFHYAKSA